MTSSQVHIAALTDDDVMIVQDFLDTKTTLLLACDAQIGEWRFEYRVMERTPGIAGIEACFFWTIRSHVGVSFALFSRAKAERARKIWLVERPHTRTTVLLLAALTARPGGARRARQTHAVPVPFADR